MKITRLIIIFISIVFTSNITAQTVYITKTGEKYHKHSCRYLKHSKKEIDLKKAKSFGYTACLVCKPTASSTQSKKTSLPSNSLSTKKETVVKKSSSKTYTTRQCSGKTKSGARCKRKTKSTNGRCFQH